MTFQKAVIIGSRKGLVEATVYNRSEVVKYLERNNWHLARETFVCVAPDEYCLVSNKALAPDMNLVNEEVVRTWSTADTTQSEDLRACKVRFYKVCRLIEFELMLMMICTIFAALIVAKSFGTMQGIIAGAIGVWLTLLKLAAFAATKD